MHGVVLEKGGDELIRIQLDSEHEGEHTCVACQLRESCELMKQHILEMKPSELEIELHTGDHVSVEMLPRHVVMLSFSVYILPLIFMILLGSIGAAFSQLFSILLSFCGLGLGLLFNVFLNRKLSVNRILTITRCL